MLPFLTAYAGMAELADALDSGSSESNFMEVQVLLPAPNSRNPNPKPVGEGFGFLFENSCVSFLQFVGFCDILVLVIFYIRSFL